MGLPIMTVDGSSHDQVPESMMADRVRRILSIMDGADPFAVTVWRLPDGAQIDDKHLDDDRPFIQCAGAADRMTVELQLHAGSSADPERHHYVLGRSEPAGPRDEQVTWDEGHAGTEVHAEELFTADETAELFLQFLDRGDVAGEVHRRAISLDVE